jgi:GNAT superfamily N-acetyltransferase
VIRAFRAEDAEGVLALTRVNLPLRVESAASILRMGAEARCWVADDGEIVGFARVRDRKLWIGVVPRARGSGIGAALWGRVEAHADEPAVCWTETEAGIAFAQSRGFTPSGRTIVSVLEIGAAAPDEASPPDGVELLPWSKLEADPSELEAVGRAESPDLRPEGSFVALVDGRPVAYSLLTTDERGLGESEYTATLPAFRRRGLATLCKHASVAWAARNRVQRIVAGNDESNEPMLAINAKLGFLADRVRTTLTRR